MLLDAVDREEIITRVAALDVGKAEVACCTLLPPERPGGYRRQEVVTYPTMIRSLLVLADRLAIADLDEDPEGAFHADKAHFDGHHGFDRERLTEHLTRAGFANVSFVDATTMLRGDREFGVFLCTATKGA